MEKNTGIIDILKRLGYKPLDRQESYLKEWDQFYVGKVDKFHEYTEYMGAGAGNATRKRSSLKMAKVISETWADNIINPETEFKSEDEEIQKWIDDIVPRMGIREQLNDLIELTFGLGTGVTIQLGTPGKEVDQQYLDMRYIYPLKIMNGVIVDCAFVEQEEDGSYYIQIHEQLDNGTYEISNFVFDKDGKPSDHEMEDAYTSKVKPFQIIKPSIVNNLHVGSRSPLGISVYANAIDELKNVDIAYDALTKEVRNGRMRMFISGEMMYKEKGKETPIFDKEQDEFYILPGDYDEPDDVLLKVEAPTLRVDALIDNLNKQLNLLGSKCGLGDNAFYSEQGTIYTNTDQVVSTNSKFYKTRQKHVTRFETALIDMFKALYYFDQGKELTSDIRIEFDDSIIHDKEAETNNARLEYANGLISAVEYFVITRKMTREDAEAFYNQQIEDLKLSRDVEEEGGEI